MSGTVMISGLPGEMGHEVAKAAVRRGLAVADVALTGPVALIPRWMQEHREVHVVEGSTRVEIKTVSADDPAAQKRALEEAKARYGENLVVVDFTSPSAVNTNAQLYAEVGVNFVMGTTGGDREALQKTAKESGVYTVIAPVMNKQVLALQASIAKMAADFPGLFEGFTLEMKESHQKAKKDESTVGQEITKNFVKMGANFPESNLQQIRDDAQAQEFGVPKESLEQHAFHTYCLKSADGLAELKFEHNIQGKAGTSAGAIDAVEFLLAMKSAGCATKTFDMADVVSSKKWQTDEHPGAQS